MATATAASSSGSKSLKEYLKRYEGGNSTEEVQKKKSKKKKKQKINSNLPSGVVVVDEDPVWQKPMKIEEEDEESLDEDKPVVNEDIEVKRMKRLEMLRMRRGYNAIAEDGSGWVTLSPKRESISDDISPPGRNRPRNDTPSPERGGKALESGRGDADLSPPRQSRRGHYSPSPKANDRVSDLSPPRKRRVRNDTPSPEPGLKRSKDVTDLSPPRRRARYDTPSPKPRLKPRHNTPSPEPNNDMSPLRRLGGRESEENNRMKSDALASPDISPPRRARRKSLDQEDIHASLGEDLSPPRKSRKNVARSRAPDLSKPPRRSTEDGSQHASLDQDISPPRRNRKESTDLPATKERPKTGLISGRDIREEISRKKRDELLRFEQLDPSVTGKGAEPVYRDKKGERISKEEYLKSKQKLEEKPKEIKIEWGKGLAQKRDAEARLQELELEKDRPFAQTRDDPEFDKMLKDRLRWGDPMAHLVKKKHPELVLADLGANEKMKESGFIVPQDIPSHSWLKRGLDAMPNRYGIKPGRHWDGVDRSNGFEKQMFKRMNEKEATEREAYLWSVSDM